MPWIGAASAVVAVMALRADRIAVVAAARHSGIRVRVCVQEGRPAIVPSEKPVRLSAVAEQATAADHLSLI